MASPTPTVEQAEILVKIVEEGDGTAVLVGTQIAGVDVLHVSHGKNSEVNPADVRALVEWGYLRQVGKQEYEVSTVGRAFYELLKEPPKEPPPVGFQAPLPDP